jgi:hypothetical protein
MANLPLRPSGHAAAEPLSALTNHIPSGLSASDRGAALHVRRDPKAMNPFSTISDLLNSVLAHIDLFAALGLVLGFVSGAMPDRRSILLGSAACATCFSLHYLRLGALTGSAMCVLSVAQSLAAAGFGAQERRPVWFAPFFAASASLVLGLTALTWAGWPSACAGIGALFALRARLQVEARSMRLHFLGASLAWAGHNILVGSPFALTCDILTLTGLVVALVRTGRPASLAAA